MAYPYPFFKFCSDVLNDPMVRTQYTTRDTADALVESYGLTKTQIEAAGKRDPKKIIAELQKELSRLARDSRVQRGGFIIW